MHINSKKIKVFGKRVQKARKVKGMTQESLSEIIGVSPTYIGFIEQGLRMPSIKTADKLARALNAKLSNLLDE